MSGWGTLGDIMGGGIDTQNAFDTGRLRTAQTEGALASARQTQLKNMASEFQAKNQLGVEDAMVKMGIDPTQANAQSTIMNAGLANDFSQVQEGAGRMGQNAYRATLANPNAPLADQFAAGQGVQGKVLNPYDQVSPQSFVDLRAPGAPGAPAPIQTTAIGQSEIGQHNAAAYKDMHPELSPSGAAEAGLDPYHGVYGKPKLGEMANPSFNPAAPASVDNLPFIQRPADPTSLAAPIGSRERGMLASVTHGVIEGSQRLGSIVKMPSGASSGLAGMLPGGNHGVGLMQATTNNLRWALSPTEVKEYNTVMGGQARNIAFIENFGRPPTEGQIASVYQQLAFMPGDNMDIESKMMKLADFRNTIENGVKTFMAMYGTNPSTPPDLIQTMQAALESTKAAVPFTMDDVTALSATPGKSLGEAMQQRRLNRPAGAAPPAAGVAPRAPAAPPVGTTAPGANFPAMNQRGWTKMQDAGGNWAYVSPDGKQFEEIH